MIELGRKLLPCLLVRRVDCANFYHAMHYSAKRGIAIACRPSICPSVCPSVFLLVDQEHIGWKSWKLIAWTVSQRLFVAQRPSTYSRGNMGKFGEAGGEVGKRGMLEHKSSNISETRKDR